MVATARVGPGSGFALAAVVCENMFLWLGNNLLPAKASFCFCQEKKKVKNNNVRDYFLPNLKSAVVLLHQQLQARTRDVMTPAST